MRSVRLIRDASYVGGDIPSDATPCGSWAPFARSGGKLMHKTRTVDNTHARSESVMVRVTVAPPEKLKPQDLALSNKMKSRSAPRQDKHQQRQRGADPEALGSCHVARRALPPPYQTSRSSAPAPRRTWDNCRDSLVSLRDASGRCTGGGPQRARPRPGSAPTAYRIKDLLWSWLGLSESRGLAHHFYYLQYHQRDHTHGQQQGAVGERQE